MPDPKDVLKKVGARHAGELEAYYQACQGEPLTREMMGEILMLSNKALVEVSCKAKGFHIMSQAGV